MNLPLTWRRRWWIARVWFHDWLWQGAADGRRVRKWIAPRLPMYLADPYWISNEEIERIFAQGEAATFGGLVITSSTWPVQSHAQTWSTGSTFTFRH